MPDTLSTFTQAMALIPDNSARLISPDDQRSVAISLMSDRGGAFADEAAGPWVIPIPAVDVWVDIPLAISVDMVESPASLFWRKDANGQLLYDYAADWPTIVVPPAMTRSVRMAAVLGIDPDADAWEFAFTIGGVILTPTQTISTATTTHAVTVTLAGSQGIDVSDAPPISVQCRNLSDATDLALLSLSFGTQGGALV